MKKFKIKEQEIFANSLHDALEIYKHKVKDSKVWIEVPDEPDARDDYQWDVKTAKKMASKYGVRLILKGKVSSGPNKGDNEAYFEGPRDKIKKIAKEIFFDYDDKELEEVIEDSRTKDAEYIKVGSKQVEVLEALPNGWRVDRNATTAPRGYVWINNNKSRFGGERESALIREELVDSISDSKVNDRDYTDERVIQELEDAIIAMKNKNYKKAMDMVRNVFTALKFQVETSRHLR